MLRTISNNFITHTRYLFNGMEADNEVKGNGNSYTTLYRQLDTRLGRWLTIDPKPDAGMSPYCTMDNNPIKYNDLLGLYTERRAKRIAERGKKDGYSTKVVDKEVDGKQTYGVYYNKKGSDGEYQHRTQFSGKFVSLEKGGFHKAKVNIGEATKIDWVEFYNVLAPYLHTTEIPKAVHIGVGYSAITGTGASGSLNFNFIIRGPQASLNPVITYTQGIGGGMSFGAVFNVGATNKVGSPILRSDFATRSDKGALPSVWGQGGISVGAKLGVSSNYTSGGIYSGELNIGIGSPTFGSGSGGVSNSYILH